MGADFLRAGIDFEHPNAARMYDYFLGGAHNFAVDRELADQVIGQMPTIREWARGNRAFLRRIVEYCIDHGVIQFLDLGSGIPTVGHVHELSRSLAPDSRVAYVDFEPVAVAYSQQILMGLDGVSITRADVRDPSSILGASSVTDVLDFSKPVAVLAVAVVHFIEDDDDPAGVVAAYADALAPGSFLALTHGSDDYDDADLSAQMAGATGLYQNSATPAWLRDRHRIRQLLGELQTVDPGLVDINRWRNDDVDAPELGNYAALVRIP